MNESRIHYILELPRNFSLISLSMGNIFKNNISDPSDHNLKEEALLVAI